MCLLHHFLLSPFMFEDDQDRLQDDPDVFRNAEVADVFKVQPYDVFKVTDLVAPADLPEPGNTRLDGHPGPVVGLVLVPLVDCGRPRANQRQLPQKYMYIVNS